MKHGLALSVFSGLALHPLAAQTPIACVAQLMPLKPLSLSCSNAAPVCLTDQNGMNGHWVWGCPSASETKPDTAWQIPLSVGSKVPLADPIQLRIEVERLRQLQLQNQQQPRTAQQVPAESNNPGTDSNSVILKAAYNCGLIDGVLKTMVSIGDTTGANGVRELYQQAVCEQIRAEAGIESVPVVQNRQPDIGEPLDNAEVIHMVKTGFKEDTLIWIIGLRPPHYSLSQTDRAELRAAGVSDAIIQAMVDKSARR